MIAVQGTVTNGNVVLDSPAELREGTRVEVLPIEANQPTLGMREEEWPTTPEGVAALLQRMDAAGPAWLPPEDDAAWRLALRSQKDEEKRRFSQDAEKLRGMWE
jgi:hypothetical protein